MLRIFTEWLCATHPARLYRLKDEQDMVSAFKIIIDESEIQRYKWENII